MLVLTRRINDSVIVGNDVKMTFLGVRIGETTVAGAQVKLGFEAPKEVSIQRQEMFDRMKSKSSSRSYGSKPNIAGKIQPIRDAVVLLQFQVPQEISIHCSRTCEDASGHRQIVSACRTESISADQEHALNPSPIRIINCLKEDNILIGNQLLITIVDVFRFVKDPTPPQSGPANLTEKR